MSSKPEVELIATSRSNNVAYMFLVVFLPLVTFGLYLTSNFTKIPWGIATSSESLFYTSIVLYFVLTDQLLTSFQEGPYHTKLVFDRVMRAKIETSK